MIGVFEEKIYFRRLLQSASWIFVDFAWNILKMEIE